LLKVFELNEANKKSCFPVILVECFCIILNLMLRFSNAIHLLRKILKV